MPTAEATQEKTIVQPFGIEADHPRMCDLLIQSIPGCKLRSVISSNKGAKNAKTGEIVIPRGQAEGLARMPRIPGMQLHVNPAKMSYAIIDPLEDDEELCDKIKAALVATQEAIRFDGRFKGVPTQKGTLDPHRMKTLVRELVRIVDAGEAVVCKGIKPEQAAIDKLPGRYLLNPGSEGHLMQPMFEDQWDDYVENLRVHGG